MAPLTHGLTLPNNRSPMISVQSWGTAALPKPRSAGTIPTAETASSLRFRKPSKRYSSTRSADSGRRMKRCAAPSAICWFRVRKGAFSRDSRGSRHRQDEKEWKGLWDWKEVSSWMKAKESSWTVERDHFEWRDRR